MEQTENPYFMLHSACTVDGFIAREDGSVDWLSKYDPASSGYSEFFDSVYGLVMGTKTYE